MAGAQIEGRTPSGPTTRRRRAQGFAALASLALVLAVAAAGVVVVSGDGSRTTSTERVTPKPAPKREPFTAVANVAADHGRVPMRAASTRGFDIPVFAAPDSGAQPVRVLSAQTEYLLPRTVLAFDEYGEWLHVYVPARPNSGTGWVRRSDVDLSPPIEWEIRVSLAEYRLWLLRNGVVEFETGVAIGSPSYPTPTGTFFVTDPIDLHDRPNLGYGVFALGLSGYSEVLFEFMGGDGQIAIHGTSNPGDVGRAVSHGCLRVTNDAVERLSVLPLGTPVVIT